MKEDEKQTERCKYKDIDRQTTNKDNNQSLSMSHKLSTFETVAKLAREVRPHPSYSTDLSLFFVSTLQKNFACSHVLQK